MDDKEMERLRAEAAAKKEMEDRMMAKMNQPTNVNLTPEAMRKMNEHLRQKEMNRLNAEAAAKKEMEDRMMTKMNGFDYPTEEEGLSPKRR